MARATQSSFGVQVQFTTDLAGTNPGTGQRLLTNGRPTHRFLFMDTNASHAPRRCYRVLETC